MEPLPHSLLFCSEGIPQMRKRQIRWQTPSQIAPFVLQQQQTAPECSGETGALCVDSTAVSPGFLNFKDPRGMQSLIDQRQTTSKIRTLSDCSQHGANIPS